MRARETRISDGSNFLAENELRSYRMCVPVTARSGETLKLPNKVDPSRLRLVVISNSHFEPAALCERHVYAFTLGKS